MGNWNILAMCCGTASSWSHGGYFLLPSKFQNPICDNQIAVVIPDKDGTMVPGPGSIRQDVKE